MKPWATILIMLCIGPASALAAQTAPDDGGLHLAVLQDDIDAIERHIAAGSDLDAKDAFGSTPLTLATTFDRTDAARLLIGAGADLELRDREGSAPLHIAALLGRVDIAEALLDAGADRQSRNGGGATAFDIAASPIADDEGLFDQLSTALGPLGLALERPAIAAARPRIAQWLRPDEQVLAAVDYRPPAAGDWPVSAPAEQGLDPALVAEFYHDAAALETLHSLLVIRNGQLIAEDYFNAGSASHKASLQSASKSIYSALVGLALEDGCLTDLDRTMVTFLPDDAASPADERKHAITIRDMLQMRAGYPWEETDPALWQTFLEGDYLPLVDAVQLTGDPGAGFQYSNLTTHWLGVVVSHACDTDLPAFAERRLFEPIGIESGEWWQDRYGYYYALLHMTARDAARFGQLYLDDGRYRGRQVIPAAWVRDSLEAHSPDAWRTQMNRQTLGRYLRNVGYGYQWWSGSVGAHEVDFAWGHGGQLIVLIPALDMIVVATAEPFFMQHDEEAWRHERANINLVGKFIASLPTAGQGASP